MITKIIGDKEYQLVIGYDECYESCKRYFEWTILCQHREYDLWNEKFVNHWKSFEDDFYRHINEKYLNKDSEEDYNEDEILEYINENLSYVPLYLYDHWSISLSASRTCGWDSWQIGYIYIHNNNKDYYNKTLYEIIYNFIDIYNQELRWEVYYYSLEEREIKTIDWKQFYSDWETIDWCWWYYNLNDIALEVKEYFTEEEVLNCNF